MVHKIIGAYNSSSPIDVGFDLLNRGGGNNVSNINRNNDNLLKYELLY